MRLSSINRFCERFLAMWQSSLLISALCVVAISFGLVQQSLSSPSAIKCLNYQWNSTECRSDAYCNGTCSSTTNTCVLGSLNCTQMQQVCDKTQGMCVECINSSNCGDSTRKFCVENVCVACAGPTSSETNPCSSISSCGSVCMNGTCVGGENCIPRGLVCDQKQGKCVACDRNAECAPLGLDVCSDGVCRACLSSSECHDTSKPLCFDGKCVSCLENELSVCRTDTSCNATCAANHTCVPGNLNCQSRNQFCDLTGVPKCVDCLTHSTCRNDTNCAATCSVNGTCVTKQNLDCLLTFQLCDTAIGECSCSSDAACVSTFPDRPFCSLDPLTGTSRCVSCTSDTMCRSETDCAAYCDLSLGRCVPSNQTAANCSSRTDNHNLCNADSGICVQCLIEDPETCPRCVNGTCEKCERDSECRMENNCGAICHLETGTCANKPSAPVLDCEKLAQNDPRHFLPKCTRHLGVCAQCIPGNEVLCIDPTPVCLYNESRCVQCLDVSHCDYAGHCSAQCINNTCVYDQNLGGEQNMKKQNNSTQYWSRCTNGLVCNQDDLTCVQCTEDSHCAVFGSHRANVHTCDISKHQCALAGWFIGIVATSTIVVFVLFLIGTIVYAQRRMVKSRISRAFSTNLSSIYEPINQDGF